MYANSLTPEQWVGKNTLDVIMHPQYRSLGAVVLMGKTSIGDCPTAYTDGLNVVYGENFISKLLDTEMRFLILHENMHKALRHMVTWL
jgi:predicted metal-dependent peptidase